jgi:hypothetical protein
MNFKKTIPSVDFLPPFLNSHKRERRLMIILDVISSLVLRYNHQNQEFSSGRTVLTQFRIAYSHAR